MTRPLDRRHKGLVTTYEPRGARLRHRVEQGVALNSREKRDRTELETPVTAEKSFIGALETIVTKIQTMKTRNQSVRGRSDSMNSSLRRRRAGKTRWTPRKRGAWILTKDRCCSGDGLGGRVCGDHWRRSRTKEKRTVPHRGSQAKPILETLKQSHKR